MTHDPSHLSIRHWLGTVALATVISFPRLSVAQTPTRPAPRSTSQSLDLAINHVGISIGNSPLLTGLRLNWRDENVVRINGINVTLWTPGSSPRGEVNGLSLGLLARAPAASTGSCWGEGASEPTGA
jgi:hypothetical protein